MMRSRSAWLETAASEDGDEAGGRSLGRRTRRPELDGSGEGSAMVEEGVHWIITAGGTRRRGDWGRGRSGRAPFSVAGVCTQNCRANMGRCGRKC